MDAQPGKSAAGVQYSDSPDGAQTHQVSHSDCSLDADEAGPAQKIRMDVWTGHYRPFQTPSQFSSFPYPYAPVISMAVQVN